MIRFTSLALVFVLCVVSTYATRVVDIKIICTVGYTDTKYCLNLLKSQQGADLLVMGRYVTDVLHTKVTNTVKHLKTLIDNYEKETTPKSHYIKCLEYYGGKNGAITKFEEIENSLKAGNYNGTEVAVYDVMKASISCNDDDKTGTEKCEWDNYYVFKIGDIMMTITSYLNRQV
ncbi:uncharacterized protein [Cicer arietinum]|uniref:Uncharacterized protein LOC101499991 n=1 Tax=Cicer arietinum TaxID=3827 RepID=A0A1S2Z8S6_CICAR|nr:uncharacterized protein LOC101499991 [Cicer arietinum]